VSNRRGFFWALAGEAMSMIDEVRGVQQCRLDQIDGQPDEVIAAMVPASNQCGALRIEDDRIVQHSSKGTEIVMKLGADHGQMLALFDGQRSVAQVAELWALMRGLDQRTAFLCVRGLFVPLAKLAILIPTTPA
jgi:hypothetical protein